MKQNKGITLIALIVTIIVMLILAGVTINLIVGDTGTVSRAENTKKENLRAQILDKIQNETKTAVDEFGNYNQEEAINNLKENYNTKIKEIVVETNKRLGVKFEEQGYEFSYVVSNRGEVTAVSEYVCEKKVDGKENTYELLAPVPIGFVASDYTSEIKEVTINGEEQKSSYYEGEDKIEYGLVIYEGNEKVDGSNLEKLKEDREKRNQFVWIPVKEEELYSLLVMDENGKFYYTKPVDYELDNSIGRKTALAVEPYFKYTKNKADSEKNKIKQLFGINGDRIEESFNGLLRLNYDNMLNSIKQWGGFYIARYEISSEEGGKNKKIVKNGITNKNGETNWFDSLYNSNNFNINNHVYTNMLTGVQLGLVNKFVDEKVMLSSDSSDDNPVYKYFYTDSWSKSYMKDFYKSKTNKYITGETEYVKVSNIYDLIRKSVSKLTKCCFR